MAAVWFKDYNNYYYNDTVNNLFHKCFTNFRKHCPWEPPQSRVHQSQSLHTIATCAPEPITAELTSMTYFKKRADLYLQQRELDQDFCRQFGPILCI